MIGKFVVVLSEIFLFSLLDVNSTAAAVLNGTTVDVHVQHHEFHIVDTERLQDDVFSSLAAVSLAIFIVSSFRVALNNAPRLLRLFPESGWLMLFGVVIGIISYFSIGAEWLKFDENVVFVVLLPPIIFESGYNVRIRFFVANIAVILSFALIGTFLNNVIISLALYGVGMIGGVTSLSLIDSFVFGSIMADVDPVAILAIFQHLHINDEVSIAFVYRLYFVLLQRRILFTHGAIATSSTF